MWVNDLSGLCGLLMSPNNVEFITTKPTKHSDFYEEFIASIIDHDTWKNEFSKRKHASDVEKEGNHVDQEGDNDKDTLVSRKMIRETVWKLLK